MRRSLHTFILLLSLALLAAPAFAQDADAVSTEYSGAGGFMVLGGLAFLVIVGVMMSRREASANDEDLV